jgi:hypothetical protein
MIFSDPSDQHLRPLTITMSREYLIAWSSSSPFSDSLQIPIIFQFQNSTYWWKLSAYVSYSEDSSVEIGTFASDDFSMPFDRLVMKKWVNWESFADPDLITLMPRKPLTAIASQNLHSTTLLQP